MKIKHKIRSLFCFSLPGRGQPSSLVLILASALVGMGEVEKKGFGRDAKQGRDEAPALVETAEPLRPWHWESAIKMVK